LSPSYQVGAQGFLGHQISQLQFESHRWKRLLQLNELKEIHSNAYESSKMYNEKMKSWHDQRIHRREFQEGDLVFLFNSSLKLFLHKLRSWWLSPYKVMKVQLCAATNIGTEATDTFKVNGLWLKHYYAGEPIDEKASYNLLMLPLLNIHSWSSS